MWNFGIWILKQFCTTYWVPNFFLLQKSPHPTVSLLTFKYEAAVLLDVVLLPGLQLHEEALCIRVEWFWEENKFHILCWAKFCPFWGERKINKLKSWWTRKNIPDRQKCVGFQKSKQLPNNSTLLCIHVGGWLKRQWLQIFQRTSLKLRGQLWEKSWRTKGSTVIFSLTQIVSTIIQKIAKEEINILFALYLF